MKQYHNTTPELIYNTRINHIKNLKYTKSTHEKQKQSIAINERSHVCKATVEKLKSFCLQFPTLIFSISIYLFNDVGKAHSLAEI